jgi:hypothetical protein
VAAVATVKLAEIITPPDIVQAVFEIVNAPRLLVIEPEPHVSITLKPLPVIVTLVPTEPEDGLSVIDGEFPWIEVEVEVEVAGMFAISVTGPLIVMVPNGLGSLGPV